MAQGPGKLKVFCSDLMQVFFGGKDDISEENINLIIKNRLNTFDTMELLSPFTGMTFVSDKRQYKLQHKIGHATNDIYLAEGDGGKLVAVKTQTAIENLWIYSVMNYEKEVTDFYLINDLPMAQILDLNYKKERPFYVVEYIKGISYEELKKYPNIISDSLRLKLSTQLLETIKKFKKVHKGFSQYLKDKNVDLNALATDNPEYQHAIDHLIRNGDIREEQFLYNFQQRRWICIDP
jgi:serine/threonine protein kinase